VKANGKEKIYLPKQKDKGQMLAAQERTGQKIKIKSDRIRRKVTEGYIQKDPLR
jgi:hypothetical protein